LYLEKSILIRSHLIFSYEWQVGQSIVVLSNREVDLQMFRRLHVYSPWWQMKTGFLYAFFCVCVCVCVANAGTAKRIVLGVQKLIHPWSVSSESEQCSSENKDLSDGHKNTKVWLSRKEQEKILDFTKLWRSRRRPGLDSNRRPPKYEYRRVKHCITSTRIRPMRYVLPAKSSGNSLLRACLQTDMT
jgi:hypothetical protein